MFTVDLFLNDGFFNDTRQVTAIKTQLIQKYPNINFIEYQDNHATTLEQLSKTFEDSNDQKHVFILSGDHGFEFIQKNPDVQTIIEQKKPIVIWVGYQDPGLASIQQYLNIVALPKHILEAQAALQFLFQDRCISLQSIPNALTAEALLTAKETWNRTYPQEHIEPAPNGYIGIFLGGDAPMPDGIYLCWDEKEAYERGLAFGIMAMAQEKPKCLLITNGPRTGKFYSESPNRKTPVVRQYKGNRWLSVDAVATQTDPDLAPHMPSSPLDPVSAAFLIGLKESGIPDTKYQFFDFKFGKPPKSAYQAMIAALHESPNSIAVYSGESISYLEIAYFIPHTYAFETKNMNNGHHQALQKFKTLNIIKELDFNKPLSAQPIDSDKKQKAIHANLTEDADNVVHFLSRYIQFDNAPKKTYMPLQQLTVSKNVLVNNPNIQAAPKLKRAKTSSEHKS
ncbi:MAG TPA: hypothetical protein VNK03_02975 [Gammaproteobacteria bacterium]|nr:hypothetical protein [Gammaproteobacteria bacterium]